VTSGGVAGDGGIDGSVVSLILRIMPQVGSGRDRATAVRSLRAPLGGWRKTRSPAPHEGRRADGNGDAGRLRCLRLRVRRSQRGGYRLRHVRRSRTAEPTVESSALTVVVRYGLLAHGVVVPVMVASVMTEVGDFEAGEEDGRDDEDDAGHDHHPRGESVEPIGFDRHNRWLGGDGGRPGWDFRCFAHT
jgi:hypothetical protein